MHAAAIITARPCSPPAALLPRSRSRAPAERLSAGNVVGGEQPEGSVGQATGGDGEDASDREDGERDEDGRAPLRPRYSPEAAHEPLPNGFPGVVQSNGSTGGGPSVGRVDGVDGGTAVDGVDGRVDGVDGRVDGADGADGVDGAL